MSKNGIKTKWLKMPPVVTVRNEVVMSAKRLARSILLFFAFCDVMADDSFVVESVNARQRYPWNAMVDVNVVFHGDTNRIASSYCMFVATDSKTNISVPVVAISKVGVENLSNNICRHHYIWNADKDVGSVKIDDLVLSVDAFNCVQLWKDGPYWSECNVGATKPEESGYYFYWGDTTGYKRNANNDGWVSVKDGTQFLFDDKSCPTLISISALESQGYIDSKGNLVSAHDAATVHLGATWRIPTVNEFIMLINNCNTTWTTYHGVWGRLVTGRGTFASKSIFLPAVGCGTDSKIEKKDLLGSYWSSMPCATSSLRSFDWSLILGFNSNIFLQDYTCRQYGLSIRPVRESVE